MIHRVITLDEMIGPLGWKSKNKSRVSRVILAVKGRLDGITAPGLEERIASMVERSNHNIVLDCSGDGLCQQCGAPCGPDQRQGMPAEGWKTRNLRFDRDVQDCDGSNRFFDDHRIFRQSGTPPWRLNPERVREMLTFSEEILLLMLDDDGVFLPIRESTMEYVVTGAALLDLRLRRPYRYRL